MSRDARRFATALVAAALLARAATTDTQTRLAAADIAASIETELKAARVPGAAIAVVSGDEVLARGVGIAEADSGTAMQPSTLVHLGSLTKLLTALAVGTALERQRLAPETAVGPYVRGLSARAASSTFHQLLSQTSGLRDRPGDSGSDVESALGDSARELGDGDYLLPAGTVFSYSNLGYSLAGAGLEGLHQRPYADAMREILFAPLGMTRSTLRVGEATKGAHAVGHRVVGADPAQPGTGKLTPVRPMANDTRIWPAGYAWSSAADVSRLLVALLNDGRVDGTQVIPTAVIKRVTAAHTPMPNVFAGGHYGYGLMMFQDRGVPMYEHGGTLPGFSSIVRLAPDRRVGIAILSNLDNAPLRRVAASVMGKALSLPAATPPPRTEAPVSSDEMQAFVGRYRNRGTAEIAVRDGRVMVMLEGLPPMAVSRIGPTRYLGRPAPESAGPEFVLEPARGATPAYLHFALWAYVKE